MKKILMTLAIAAMHLSILAQGIEVVSDTPLSIPTGEPVYSPVISPTGEFVLVTSASMQGLQKFNLATSTLETLTTDAGAGYNVSLSNDGKTVVYRQSVFKNRLRYNTVKGLDLTNKKTKTLVRESRNVTAFSVAEGTAIALEKGKLKKKHFSGKKISDPTVVSIESGNLMLTKDGRTLKFNPKGETRYLWPSLSPDGKKVLFAIPENGMVAYVCDLNGNNLTRIGRMSAPKWMGNDWVVGMDDKDNGEVYTESKIVAARVNGADYTTLTDGQNICMYPTATLDATKIVYNTTDGQIRLMTVKTK